MNRLAILMLICVLAAMQSFQFGHSRVLSLAADIEDSNSADAPVVKSKGFGKPPPMIAITMMTNKIVGKILTCLVNKRRTRKNAIDEVNRFLDHQMELWTYCINIFPLIYTYSALFI